MNAPLWPDLEALFHEALAQPSAERAAFLAARCAGQPELQAQIDAMLRAHDEAASGLNVSSIAPRAALQIGARLGTYEILGPLGAGGMGEVYRARDTTLGREVAIKVVPDVFRSDPERLARFEREARVLATLNHPHIGAIYGVQEADPPPGSGRTAVRALVLELVEGATLAERLAAGPVPMQDALTVARQIADALEAAHERGIVHRDLKPGNVKITPDGTVKVLDFGLAKIDARDGAAPSPWPAATAGGTRDGVILGTAAYMSPEQARGMPVDKRTDIWAFGCVLFEMLTGQQAFAGETVSDTIAAILGSEPEWAALPAATPATVRRLLQHCLEKDPRQRVRDIGDARLDLDDTLAGRGMGLPVARHPRRERVAWAALALVTVAAALAAGGVLSFRRAPAEARMYRSSIVPPPGGGLPALLPPSARFALSPDGRQLAFVGGEPGGVTRLWVQSLDGLAAQALSGTEAAIMPFWSPDSRFIGFLASGKVKTIDAAGGPPLTLADTAGQLGATWNRDGVILFATFPGSPIRRVSASGGAPVPVTTLNADAGETHHSSPFFLPDGRHFLYLAIGSKTAGPMSPNGIYVAALDTHEQELLVSGGSNPMYADGYLFFLREQTLMAQPFDLERLRLAGDAVPIAEHVTTGGASGGLGGFSVSETGVLAYQTGSAGMGGNAGLLSRLVWFDRGGKPIGVLGDQASYGDLELAPDGGRATVSVFDPVRRNRDIWLFDIARGVGTPFTFDPDDEYASVWSPDGSRVVFNSRRNGHMDLYQKASSGDGAEVELLADDLDRYPVDWSPDGRFILMGVGPFQAAADLWVLPLAGDRKPAPFLRTPFSEVPGRFSTDGRWIAYASNESGRSEVYVAPFPGRGGKWQVSKAGGNWPRWRSDGRELFYLAPDNTLMAAAVNGRGSTFEVGAARALFATRAPPINLRSTYDVSADGQRFLIITLAEEAALAPITLVVNWPALLKN